MKPLYRWVLMGVLMVVWVPVLGSCAQRASEGGFDSDNPAARLYAIRQAGEGGDRSAVPRLIDSLESDDPAERVLAIQALERLTAQRYGYDPHASWSARQAAVQRWEQAWRNGTLSTGQP